MVTGVLQGLTVAVCLSQLEEGAGRERGRKRSKDTSFLPAVLPTGHTTSLLESFGRWPSEDTAARGVARAVATPASSHPGAPSRAPQGVSFFLRVLLKIKMGEEKDGEFGLC